MKQLTFTPDNLRRHLSASPREFVTNPDGTKYPLRRKIYTTRDHKLGYAGEIFCVEEPGINETGYSHFVLDEIIHVSGTDEIFKLFTDYYEEEGFDNSIEFINEIVRIYGKLPNDLYVHVFKEVFI